MFVSAVMIVLATLGAAMATLTGQTSGEPTGLQIFYWYILPALPFLALAISAAFPSMISRSTIFGAAGGAVLAIAIPYLALWVALKSSNGGGANIGVGLLFLAMPLYLVPLMVGGSAVGKVLRQQSLTR